ncbi:MAG: hypothetical protein QGI08_03910 [Paracoccaceae bacterium]|jgi:hypothetical protein|nr:hypothetical protein [Paracoccaceae bacterium]MDP7184847.1 hypothetical protein [Paracoccaceae bacterium]
MTDKITTTETITLTIPFKLKKRGGRKEMVLPDFATPPPKLDNALIKSLARAHRWKRLVDEGHFASIKDLAEHEKIPASYMIRTMRLTTLAPDIVEAILKGRNPNKTLRELLDPFTPMWAEQRWEFGYHDMP